MISPARRSAPGRRRRRRPRLVALVGVDGSGKTTQAQWLAAELSRRGVPARYSRNAGGRRWLGRLAQRLGRGGAERLLGRSGLLVVESVLRWLAIVRGLLLATLTGRVAVMDRYSYCQYASIRTHGARRWEWLARLAYRIFPVPDVTFLLAVRPEEAYRRIERRGTDHETVAYLSATDAAYRSLPEHPLFVVIDANDTPDQVARAISGHLGMEFGRLAGGRSGQVAKPGADRTEDRWGDRRRGRKVGSFALGERTFAGTPRRG